MELKNTHDFEDKVIGAQSEQMFTIDTDNHVIFDILRSKMYSNPIAAICREVASNARDANREAGLGMEPVKISIIQPNEILFVSDMSIVFEDRGPGISPDRMSDIFLKYGASTKRDTNAQTGGFGLGAKTPFAYSDTFTVMTINEGQRYIYTAMIDSTGKGKMVLLSQENTTEPSGTKIIVPISSDDRYQFERECILATTFWKTRPILKGFNNVYPDIEDVVSQEDKEGNEIYRVVYDKNGTWGSGRHWVALIDGISYVLDSNQVNTTYSLETDHILLINFDNGDLTLSASREQLQYDESTIEVINEKLDEIVEALSARVKKYVNKAKTYVEACLRRHTLDKGVSRYNSDNGQFEPEHLLLASIFGWMKKSSKVSLPKKWKGRELIEKVPDDGMRAWLYRPTSPGSKDPYHAQVIDKITPAWSKYPVIFKDSKVNDNRRNSTLFKEHQGFILIEARPYTSVRKEVLEKQSDKLMDFVFNWGIHIVNYSTIQRDADADVVTSSNRYQKKEEVNVPVVLAEDGKVDLSGITFLRSKGDFEDAKDYIYGEISSAGDPENKSRDEQIRLQRKWNEAAAISELTGKTVILMTPRSIKSYCNNTKAQDIKEAIERIKENKPLMEKLQKEANVSLAKNALERVEDNNVYKYLKIKPRVVDMLEKIVSETPNVRKRLVFDMLGIEPDMHDYSKEIEEFYENWENENWVEAYALNSIYRWRLENKERRELEKLEKIKESLKAKELIKQLGPTTRAAATRAKVGSSRLIQARNAIYLAQ